MVHRSRGGPRRSRRAEATLTGTPVAATRRLRSPARAFSVFLLAAALVACDAVVPPAPGTSRYTVRVDGQPADEAAASLVARDLEVALGTQGVTARVAASGSSVQITLTDPSRQLIVDRLTGAGEGVRLLDPLGQPALEGGRVVPGWAEIARGAELTPGEVHLEPSPEMRPVVAVRFGPDAAARLATWTTDHVGESLVVAVGERIVAVPTIQEPLRDGSLGLSLVDQEQILPLLAGLWSDARVTFERTAV